MRSCCDWNEIKRIKNISNQKEIFWKQMNWGWISSNRCYLFKVWCSRKKIENLQSERTAVENNLPNQILRNDFCWRVNWGPGFRSRWRWTSSWTSPTDQSRRPCCTEPRPRARQSCWGTKILIYFFIKTYDTYSTVISLVNFDFCKKIAKLHYWNSWN